MWRSALRTVFPAVVLVAASAVPQLAATGSEATVALTPATATVAEGRNFTLVARFTPAGTEVPGSFVFDWGDGTATERPPPSTPPYTVRARHLYGEAGTYLVRVQVARPGLGPVQAGSTVTVALSCGGQPVTIDARSARPGPVLGTAGPDVILGSRGPDDISGAGGADVICGGGGADRIDGGEGDDLLLGGAGADTLLGGPGEDGLAGGGGRDLLQGGPGRDVLHGGGGVDQLLGQEDADFLFRSEYPGVDRLDGGPGENVVDVGKRGTEASGIRRYVTQAQALAFQGSHLLGEFTTYHDCCQNRVVNIQLMADAIHGHLVMPGETFSVNATVGRRTTAKGYLPAGAIIGGYVQCCGYADNIGGGTSQFGTTIYNAAFFAGLEDVEHQPHSLDFARYPDGREATMGYPHPDVAFRNDTDHPVLITTHHAGHQGTSITVRIWGDNGGRQVSAGASPRRSVYNTTRVVEEIDYSLGCGRSYVKVAAQPGFTIDVFRYIDYPNGTRTTEKWTWTYSAGPEVRRVGYCAPAPGGGTMPAPDPGGGGLQP